VKTEITDRMIDLTGEKTPMPDFDARQISPLVLAWIGDGVYEIEVRNMLTRLAGIPGRPVRVLHREASSLVNAGTQSLMMAVYEEKNLLTEEELQVYHRGRNAKSDTHAKNASIQDYRRATGFEALIGYLYLTGNSSRITALIRAGFEGLKTDE